MLNRFIATCTVAVSHRLFHWNLFFGLCSSAPMTTRPITSDLYSNIQPKCPNTLTDMCWRSRLSTASCGRQNVRVRTSLIQMSGIEMGQYIDRLDIDIAYHIVHFHIENFDISIFSIYRFKIGKCRCNESMDINGISFPFCSLTWILWLMSPFCTSIT